MDTVIYRIQPPGIHVKLEYEHFNKQESESAKSSILWKKYATRLQSEKNPGFKQHRVKSEYDVKEWYVAIELS